MNSLRLLASTAVLLLSSTAVLAQQAPGPAGPPPADAPGGMPGGPGGPPPAMPSMADVEYEAEIEIADGQVLGTPGKTRDGSISGSLAQKIALRSDAPARNGLIVRGGRSAYTLRDSSITLSGPGTNDFLGTGAGVLVREGATLVLDGARIETNARISSAVVAAEESTLRIFNSHLVANGGPLPKDYKPVIGPGMMEPPAPLGLVGTARTLLAMSNSRTFIYDSHIEADGWGSVSTDATGGALYLEVNRSTIKVRRDGYGTYADFGAHVVVRNSRIDSGGPMSIIAGKARTDYDGVQGRAAENAMMIHSVMAFDATETAEFSIKGGAISTGQAAILVKSANARITLDGASISSDTGVLVDVRKNDDPNATRTGGKPVPGVTVLMTGSTLNGDLRDSDPDRATSLHLEGSHLEGALQAIVYQAGSGSTWLASADSAISLADAASLATIDARAGVTVRAGTGTSGIPVGSRTLPAGGTLLVTAD